MEQPQARRRPPTRGTSRGRRCCPCDFDILVPSMRTMPWREQTGEGLAELGRSDAHIAQGPREEAGIEQVQDGVLDAADVLVDRHPTGHQLRVERPVGGPRVAEAQEVPRRIHEGVHGVGLAGGRSAALWACRHAEGIARGQGRDTGRLELDVVGGEHGQLVLGHRHDAVVRAVDDGDRAAPESLPRHQPVAQPVVHRSHADAFGLQPLDGLRLGLGYVEAVEPPAVDLLARPGVRAAGTSVRAAPLIPALGWLDRAHDGQVVGLGEVPVAGIFGRDSHDGAGAVAHEHVVGHVDGHGLAVERVDDP